MTLSDDERRQLRRTLRQRRRQLTPHQQRLAATGLCQILSQVPAFQHAKRVGLYLASDGEIDPKPLLDLLRKRGKLVYLPVLHPILHNRLWFAEWHASDTLRPNRFGIPEPDIRQRQPRQSWTLDLVLMPLVGFDANGGRLGMGGGFFDRSFAWKRSAWGKARSRPLLLGIAHHFQEVPSLPIAPWDIPLNAIATDRHYFRVNT